MAHFVEVLPIKKWLFFSMAMFKINQNGKSPNKSFFFQVIA